MVRIPGFSQGRTIGQPGVALGRRNGKALQIAGSDLLDDAPPSARGEAVGLAADGRLHGGTAAPERHLVDIDCSGGDVNVNLALNRVTVLLDPGDDVTCTFVNEEEFFPESTPVPTNTARPATPTRTPVAEVSAVVATPTRTAVVSSLPSTGSGGYSGDNATLWLGLGLMAAGTFVTLFGFHARRPQ